ncbi:MAG: FliI/YscN family ATPase [Deltaproteobacteria bacterium]|nr:FliI/YscN family ATPase [Deltaproteobacteria bacterium]
MSGWVPKDPFIGAVARMPRLFMAGEVSRVLGLIVEGRLPRVPVGALCQIRRQAAPEVPPIPAEVIGLKGETAVLMPIGETTGIAVGDAIEPVRDAATVKVTADLLGRVIDGCGEPMDGGPALRQIHEYPLYAGTQNPVMRQRIQQPLSLGIRAIDGFLSCAVGQRVVIMAGSGVGKSTLMGMIARNADADLNVIGLIGERGREVREFIEESLGAAGLARSVVIVATSDAPPLVRMRAAFVTTSIAEYFRDQGKTVLLMMDSLTRFAMASREVGLALGEPPTMKGYTPSLFSQLPRLLERVGTSAGQGHITGLYTILTEGDDLMDPIADAVRAIVDGHIVLTRKLAVMNHYPPIDVLQSLSRVMDCVTTTEHLQAMRHVRRAYALYQEMEDFIKMGVYSAGKNPQLDQAIAQIGAIQEFLQQRVEERTAWSETVARLQQIAEEVGV